MKRYFYILILLSFAVSAMAEDVKTQYIVKEQFISQAEYDSLSKMSYEMEKRAIKIKSSEGKKLFASLCKNDTIRRKMYEEFDCYNVKDLKKYCLLDTINYYKQTGQYEFIMEVPNFTMAVMLTPGVADPDFMQSMPYSYAQNGLYAGAVEHDSDFVCDIWFYRYDKASKKMVRVAEYENHSWAFEEYGDYRYPDIKWIAPNKLLCRGYRDIYDESWNWNDGLNSHDESCDGGTLRKKRANHYAYCLLTLEEQE